MLKFTEGTTLAEWIERSLLEADHNGAGHFVYTFGFTINGVEYFDKVAVPDTVKKQEAVYLSSYDTARRTLQAVYAKAGIVIPKWVDNDASNIGASLSVH